MHDKATCLQCRGEFVRTRARIRFCSPTCAAAWDVAQKHKPPPEPDNEADLITKGNGLRLLYRPRSVQVRKPEIQRRVSFAAQTRRLKTWNEV